MCPLTIGGHAFPHKAVPRLCQRSSSKAICTSSASTSVKFQAHQKSLRMKADLDASVLAVLVQKRCIPRASTHQSPRHRSVFPLPELRRCKDDAAACISAPQPKAWAAPHPKAWRAACRVSRAKMTCKVQNPDMRPQGRPCLYKGFISRACST